MRFVLSFMAHRKCQYSTIIKIAPLGIEVSLFRKILNTKVVNLELFYNTDFTNFNR
jgi:hypothetical protein